MGSSLDSPGNVEMLATVKSKLCTAPPKHSAGNPNGLEAALNEMLCSEEYPYPRGSHSGLGCAYSTSTAWKGTERHQPWLF